VSLVSEHVIDLRDGPADDLVIDLRTRERFAELRAIHREQVRYFGTNHPGITSHQNGADAVGTLYL
jgi:hypothetical protein